MADTKPTTLPALQDPPTSIDPAVRPTLVSIIQALRTLVGYAGKKQDAAVTWRDLGYQGDALKAIGSAIVGGTVPGVSAGGTGGSGTAPAPSSPTTPTNLRTSGGISVIFTLWDRPSYPGHAYTEIWSASEQSQGVGNFSSKTLIGMSTSSLYADPVSPQTTRYYWIRHVNALGVAGNFSPVAGVKGSSSLDPSYIVPILANQISESQLSYALGTRLNSADTSISSLRGRYTVKIDSNGYVTGFGLASDSNNGTPYSSFMVRADCFSIASPSGPGVTPSVPFIVRTTATTINGQSVPAGVYLQNGFIQNGTINNLAFDRASGNRIQIVDADIGTLSVSKLLAGSLGVNQYISSTNFVAGSQGWTIRADGSAEFQNVKVRGDVEASTLRANTAMVGTLNLVAESASVARSMHLASPDYACSGAAGSTVLGLQFVPVSGMTVTTWTISFSGYTTANTPPELCVYDQNGAQIGTIICNTPVSAVDGRKVFSAFGSGTTDGGPRSAVILKDTGSAAFRLVQCDIVAINTR